MNNNIPPTTPWNTTIPDNPYERTYVPSLEPIAPPPPSLPPPSASPLPKVHQWTLLAILVMIILGILGLSGILLLGYVTISYALPQIASFEPISNHTPNNQHGPVATATTTTEPTPRVTPITPVPTQTPIPIAPQPQPIDAHSVYQSIVKQLDTHHSITLQGSDNRWNGWPYTPEHNALVWTDTTPDGAYTVEVAVFNSSSEAQADYQCQYNNTCSKQSYQGNPLQGTYNGKCLYMDNNYSGSGSQYSDYMLDELFAFNNVSGC